MSASSDRALAFSLPVLAAALAAAFAPLPVAAQLIECGVGGNNQIVTTCGERNVPLRIKLNNAPPQNPNANHSVQLGIGVGSGVHALRDSTISVSPDGSCVESIPTQVAPMAQGACPDSSVGPHFYHTKGSKTVSYNTGQALTLARVNIAPFGSGCPGACDVTVPIDYFFEGPDADAEATYDTDDCTTDPEGQGETLLAPTETLQPRATCTFEITCTQEEPSKAVGQGETAGKAAYAYVQDEIEPGVSLVSLDSRNAGQAAYEVMEFSLGVPGGDLLVGSASGDVLEWNQLHVPVPTPVVDGFRNPDGVLQYYVSTPDGLILYSTAGVGVPSTPPLAAALLAVALAATGAWWTLRIGRKRRAA